MRLPSPSSSTGGSPSRWLPTIWVSSKCPVAWSAAEKRSRRLSLTMGAR